jgi:hypothetical protein
VQRDIVEGENRKENQQANLENCESDLEASLVFLRRSMKINELVLRFSFSTFNWISTLTVTCYCKSLITWARH